MFNNLGFTELLVIAVIALVVFGPNKLPDIGKSVGKALREFKNATREVQDQIVEAVKEEPKKG